MATPSATPRLAVLCDFREENWPSMDLVGDMLVRELAEGTAAPITAVGVRPPFRPWASELPVVRRRPAARNADRLLNRLWHYPRFVRRMGDRFDAYHVADHSYAQLVHELPAGRAGVFCHDLDTFGCLLDPARDPRPRWFRAMARHVLRGMQKAAVVFHSTAAVRGQIERHGLVDPARLVAAPYGTSPEYTPAAGTAATDEAGASQGVPGTTYLMHVGSCIPRKRVDVLLDVFTAVRSRRPGDDVRLVQVGGEWTPPQQEQIRRLNLGPVVTQLRGLSRAQIASLYRGARVVLQPSDAEGFGLPVIEALACGAAVVASDIPVLREVGGPATVYCRVGDVAGWADVVEDLLARPDVAAPPQDARLTWAARYSWAAHAATVAGAYLKLLGTGTGDVDDAAAAARGEG